MDSESDSNFHLIPFLDRLHRLVIGSAHFERCYRAALTKYARTGSLDKFSLDFSITNGAFLTHPYADAELLVDGDGRLKVYWRHRRHTTKPGLDVRWVFGAEQCPQKSGQTSEGHSASSFHNPCYDGDHEPPEPQYVTTPSSLVPFGQIFDHNGSLIFRVDRSASTSHRYFVYRSKADPAQPTAFLEIEGRPSLKAWLAKRSGMARTSLVFRVYGRRRGGSDGGLPNRLLATLEPIIDGATFRSDSKAGNELMSVKYESVTESREVKAAVLGAAFLLCLRHYMKEMYRAFERVTAEQSP